MYRTLTHYLYYANIQYMYSTVDDSQLDTILFVPLTDWTVAVLVELSLLPLLSLHSSVSSSILLILPSL